MPELKVEIDVRSGFCGGVVRAINTAEKHLDSCGMLCSLGEIVHNEEELSRLGAKGLVPVASLSDVPEGAKVLIRAHGVPPEIYAEAESRSLEVVDCTCPVVLRLQKSIREAPGKVLIFGKHGHPEVQGLVGQTSGAVVFQDLAQLQDILPGLDRNLRYDLFSQTTMSPSAYLKACELLSQVLPELVVHKTICSQVASRHDELESFAAGHDVVVFVSGSHSSNGRVLFDLCRSVNPRTYMAGDADAIDPAWFKDGDSVGISGATSTPRWLLERVAAALENLH